MGIAVMVAIQLAKESSVDGFRKAIDQMSGKAALEISAPGGLADGRVRDLLGLESYGLLCPVVEGEAEAGAETLHILGVDILKDQEIRDYELVDFGGGRAQPTPTEFLNLLKDANSIILTQKLAQQNGWKIGDKVEMAFADQLVSMRIAGLLLDRGAARASGGRVALMDIAAAQWRLGKLGRIDRLEIKLREGVSVHEAERNVAAVLPAGLAVSRPQQRGAEVEKMQEAYHFNLTLLSGIAFLAGLYVIYNSVSLSVIGRRREIGMLRTLGIARGKVAGLFLLEAAMMAVPGCLLGLWLGRLLGHGAVNLTQLTAATLYRQQQVILAPLSREIVVPAVGLGVVLALVAALRPALEAARLAPVTVVRDTPDQAVDGSNWKRRIWWMLGIFVAAWVACLAPPVNGLPVFGALACLLGVAGASVATPLLLRVVLRWMRGLMNRRLGAAGQLAWGNLAAGQNRMGIPISALGGTLALTTAIAIMVGSFRETLNYWINTTLSADLYIRPGMKKAVGTDASFSKDSLGVIEGHPMVDAVDALRNFDIPYGGSRVVLNTADFEVAMSHGKILFQGITDWRSVLEDCIREDAVVVSEPLAMRHGVQRGTNVELATPRGLKSFPVKAVYFDYSNDRGSVTMDHRTYAKFFEVSAPTNLAVYLKPGADPEKVREEMTATLGTGKRVQIFTNATLRDEVMRIFDRTFSITWALEGIAIVVAMVGVVTTILTLVLERKGELAILRQLGASKALLRHALSMEAGVIGGMSQLIGVTLGFGLSLVLVYVINVQSFGWTIQFQPPWGFLMQFSLVLPAATAFAGWMFASRILKRARKRSVLDVSEE